MGAAVTLNRIKIETGIADIRDKYMVLDFNYPEYNRAVRFAEESYMYYYETSPGEIKPKFCLIDGMSIDHCSSFIVPEFAKQYVLIHGEPCSSFKFRPGSLIYYQNEVTPEYIKDLKYATDYIASGQRCHFIKRIISWVIVIAWQNVVLRQIPNTVQKYLIIITRQNIVTIS